MKKTLLFVAASLLLMSASANAQTNLNADKTWDFGNDAAWTGFAGVTSVNPVVVTVVDNLGFGPHSTSTSLMGQVAANTSTPGFADSYSYIQRMQFNGSSTGSTLPTQRFLTFKAAGACKISVWVKASAGGRTMNLSDGTAILASATAPDSATGVVLNYDYTGTVGKTFYLSNDAAMYIYKIFVDFAPFQVLATGEVGSPKNVEQIFGLGNTISLRNISSKSDVKVYTMGGALVKSKAISSNDDIEMNPGIYIVNVKSSKGEEISKKVIIK